MAALDTDDLAVVTGEPTLHGDLDKVFFKPGDVVRVVLRDGDGTVLAIRDEEDRDGLDQWIDVTSLTPLSEIQENQDVKWGDLLDPNYVHDYVWEGVEDTGDDE